MKISREEVLRVAELAHLELSEAEVAKYLTQLDSILEYAAKLNSLDTSNVEPMTQVVAGLTSAHGDLNPTFREDVVVPCDISREVLERAPDAAPPYFRVPKVIER
jgi:aspartyl-tRNA(Asn)/glutamyl-tRNA(Gln) amidotransferase subunit C|nr:Asp-tRNA(Asn)/Glu-tRNA(Gln) amidotransferase subunit GatC [Candidatus Acidoferrales bacterium]